MLVAEVERLKTMEIKNEHPLKRIRCGKSEDLEDQLIEALMQRASGMFHYVQLQISLVMDRDNNLDNPAELLSKTQQAKNKTYLREIS